MSAVLPALPPLRVPPGFGDTPVGAVVAYAGPVAATGIEAWGWMLCDGRLLASSQYPELFAVLGHLYGGANDTFQLPDYRGCFLRGRDADGNAAAGTGLGQGAGPVSPQAAPTSVDVSYLIKFTCGMRGQPSFPA